jgi:pyridoxamine 5'-phosphate oxidase
VIPDDYADPLQLCAHYYSRAKTSEPQDPTAMALATASAAGRPSVRMVLLKSADERGFVFYTNYHSRKGAQLAENPHAALCLHWPVMQVQVRCEGAVERLTAAESDEYFQSRPRGSQIAAWSSMQSSPLPGRAVLLARYAELEQRYAQKSVPRPEFWGGYRLRPDRVEFWAGEVFRMHDRLLYERAEGGSWKKTRLYP